MKHSVREKLLRIPDLGQDSQKIIWKIVLFWWLSKKRTFVIDILVGLDVNVEKYFKNETG